MLSSLRRSLFPVSTGLDADRIVVRLDGISVPIRLKNHPRARRFVLKFDPGHTSLTLTMPPGASPARAREFAERQSGWIRSQLKRAPAPVPFIDGARVPVRGVEHMIHHRPGLRGTVKPAVDENGMPAVFVAGEAPHLTRRLTDWLRAQARIDIADRVLMHTRKIGTSAKRIRISDPKTRWGSCSSTGTLSFSWRLIMAPPFVLDYVAAHEVAHMIHMDHSDRFWQLARELYGDDVRPAQTWLKRQGPALHSYGAATETLKPEHP